MENGIAVIKLLKNYAATKRFKKEALKIILN